MLAAVFSTSVVASEAPAAGPDLPPGALRFGECEAPLPFREGDDPAAYARKLIAWREAQPERFAASPVPDVVRLIPDVAHQAELHLVYDEDALVIDALKVMIEAASPHGTVVLHVRYPDEVDRAAALLASHGGSGARLALSAPPERIWLRDFAGHPAQTSAGPARIDFGYTVDCVVDDAWSATLGPVVRVPLWVEGGSLLTDGTRCYVAEQVAPDNGLTAGAAAHELRGVGCVETVWLKTMPETIAHIDPFLALGDPGPGGRPTFLLAAVDAAEDLELHLALEENARRLRAHGEVHRVMVPASRPLAPYLNVLPFNEVVLVPVLRPALDEPSLEVLRLGWPARTLVEVPSQGLASLEGGPHCLSATRPHTSAPTGRQRPRTPSVRGSSAAE